MNKSLFTTLAVGGVLLSSGLAQASTSPFALQSLHQGYMVADAGTKAADHKCGADMNKASNSNCAAKVDTAKPNSAKASASTTQKMQDGKCGEGKCGANKSKK